MLNCICSNCNTRIDVMEETYCSECFENLQTEIIYLKDIIFNLESQIEELKK